MRKIKNQILILIFSVVLAGCQTVEYVDVPLPDVYFERPERPVLNPIDFEIPDSVEINTLRLMSYAEQLEICVDNWERFYAELKDSREKN